MSLDVRPIFSALLRNRTGAVLVALQVAIALAVLTNAVFIVEQRLTMIGRSTGLDEENIFVIDSTGFGSHFDYSSSVKEDLAYLRGLSGVVAASPINHAPLSGGGSGEGVQSQPHPEKSSAAEHSLNYFETDEQGIQTLGAHLIAGRNFRPEEIQPPFSPDHPSAFVPQIILTKKAAETLFPKQNALGKTVYDNEGHGATVIGLIDDVLGSWPNIPEAPQIVGIFPRLPLIYGFYYLVRTQPEQRNSVMRTVEEHMATSNPDRVIRSVKTLSSMKRIVYLSDRNMAIFLATVTVLLLAITSLGIFGLATFNVSTRTKQIGTRRAVGARRGDIIRYFMVENGLITTTGVVVGCALALGVGYWLSEHYRLPRLDLYYLVGGVLGLWTIGQFAVWQPARRASRVSPSVATRTV
jgi:putative ABC transport system permease protein